jgi:triacylglycerol lipase
MMTKRFSFLLLASFVSSAFAINSASALTNTYQYCSVSGCRVGASETVTSSYAQTKYPVVLAHGASGFSGIAGYDYFYGIGPDLTSNGAQVFETQVASLNSSYVRGEQLLSQVKQILAITGASKVNLIGHSQGGIDVRYVSGLIPSHIASVTAVGGPELGSPAADKVQAFLDSPVGPVVAPIISSGINAFFTLIGVASGHYYDQDSLADLKQLTTAAMTTFNTQFPDGMPTTECGQGSAKVNGVNYYSWSGIGKATTVVDLSDELLVSTGLLVPGDSDGLVPQCSSHLGVVIRDTYLQNHLDEVNQIAGLVSPFDINPVALYRQQANRLKTAGL